MAHYYGLKCPECGNIDKFLVETKSLDIVHADGKIYRGNPTFKEDSQCECVTCNKLACVRDFRRG